jgi:hypothetical protein
VGAKVTIVPPDAILRIATLSEAPPTPSTSS